MPAPALPAAASPARIDPNTFLWLLVALSLATMNAPADVWATIDHLRVPDTDDAMRLVGVRDLVAGQGWFDNVWHRFQPPGGVPSHWSRLVDAPIAGLFLLFTPLLGQRLGEGLAAVVWPSLLFGVFALVLYRGVRARFGARAAILAVLVATQTMGITVQFQAGRVDHHNVQMIAILGLALCVIRGSFGAGLVGGGLAALSLAVGLEGLHYIVLGALYLALDWVLRGRPALPGFLGFGLGLPAACLPLYALQTAPPLWTVTSCDMLAPPWLWLALGGGASAAVCALLDRRLTAAPARLAVAGACGAAVVGVFALLFPVCLGGPYPYVTALVRDRWMLTVNEMTSVPRFVARGQWEILVFYPVMLIASLAATGMAWRGPGALSAEVDAGSARESASKRGPGGETDRDAIGHGSSRRFWSVTALFLWPGLILGFFQFRGLYVATGFVPMVAGPVIDRALALFGDGRRAGWRRWGAAGLAASLVSSVWLAPEVLAEALAPSAHRVADPMGAVACHADEAVAPLKALPAGTVLAPIFLGPSILLRTPHTIVAAPYHRAIPGLTAAILGFGGTEADLRRSVEGFGVRYLVACPARPADPLRAEPAFATRLARGEAAADWLEPVPMPGVLKVWKVLR